MPFTPNLPPLHSDGPFANLSDYGVWSQAADLRALANAMKVGADVVNADDIKSIPDAWAQAHVFQEALLDPTHEMHLAVRRQWRGLLALVALQPEFKTVYDLDIETLPLADHERAGRRFRRVLRDLSPLHSLTGAAGAWDDAAILYFQERVAGSKAFASANPRIPAGLLSPSVLLVAGKSRDALHSAQVPWMKSGLSDPVEAKGLNERHYEVLARFIENLTLSVNSQVDDVRDNLLFTRLRRQLQDYYEACKARVKSDHVLREVDLGLNPSDPLFAGLNTTYALDVGALPAGFSDCRLATRRELGGALGRDGLKGAILIDPAMASESDSSVVVWKNYSLNDARAPQTLEKIKSEALAEGWLVVQPDDLFTQDLVRFADGTDIPGHGRRGFEAALMPFSPLVLLLMTGEELVASSEMIQRGGECVVSLDLPLLSREGLPSKRRHKLVRRYSADDVKDEDRPNNLAVWPNFRSRDWRWTFLRFNYAPDYDIQPRFGLSAEFLAAEAFEGRPGFADKARRLYEWANRDQLVPDQQLFAERVSRLPTAGEPLLLSRLRYNDTSRVIGEFQHLPLGLEAIFFARRTDGRGSERPVGLSLVAQETVEKKFSEATVAIDFGTTNTIAYTSRSGSAVQLEDRLLFPIRSTDREMEQRNELRVELTNFFPSAPQAMPFSTVVKRQAYQGEFDPALQTILQRGHPEHGFSDVIFFLPVGLQAFTGEVWQKAAEDGTLIFNIKWAEDEPTRGRAKRFLRQLMMMVAAELLVQGVSPRDIRWRFSYPEAFSKPELGYLRKYIEQNWDELFGERDVDPPSQSIAMVSESAAAAAYFMYDEEATKANKLMLMLDIGGGTTDIAIWHDDEMIWRNSVRVAGGHFFTRYLANNPEILSRIELKGFGRYSGAATSATHSAELFINAPGFASGFDKVFPAVAMEREGAGLRFCATVALGGIMHYVGLVLRRLVREEKVDAKDLQQMTVAFGGRGSAFYRMFNSGERFDTELTQIARIAVAAATREDPRKSKTDTQFSKQPKHEVARGLLLDQRSVKRPGSAITPLGESITFTGPDGQKKTVAPEEDIHELLGAESIVEPELEEFLNFLIGLKTLTGVTIDPDAKHGEAMRVLRRTVSQKVKAAVRGIQEGDDQEGVQLIEPPFITAVRGLVEMMGLPIAERDKILAVSEKLR